MDAKEYLMKITHDESVINAKKLRLEALRDIAEHVSGPVFSDMPKVKRRSDSPVAEAIIEAATLEKEIENDELSLNRMKVFMLELIGDIKDPNEESVIIERYFNHSSWEDIAKRLYYSVRWIYVLHGRALQKLNAMQID